MSNDSTAVPARDPASARSPHLLDRASVWLVALVFTATTAISLQVVWWSWHPAQELDSHKLDSHGTWDILSIVVSAAGLNAWVHWLLVAGAAVVALAAIGIILQRAWGYLLALPCSASLIACAVLARYVAVFSEPRQYVSRSPYVQAATVVALITVVSHGAAVILGVRLLCRRPVRLVLARLTLATLAVLVAGLPGIWIHEHLPGGARNAVMMCACAAAALAALVACCLPRRGAVLASIGVSVTALAVLAVGLMLHLRDRPRRGGLYSRAAEQAIGEVVVVVPYVLALIAVCIVLRYHLAGAHGPKATAQASSA